MTTPGVNHGPLERAHPAWIGAAVGAVVGFAIGALLYLLVTPALEASDGFLRELQGLAWNMVPGLALVGAVLGWAVVRGR